jgi:histidine triad (HIT) family protein
LTQEEWEVTYILLQEVKQYIDEKHEPKGLNLGWNCGEVGGQHIFHAHFHIIPRYKDEPFAGKGIRYMFKGNENQRNSYFANMGKGRISDCHFWLFLLN